MSSPGASSWKMLVHKGRGFMQVLYDIGPKRFIVGILVAMMCGLVWSMLYYHSTLNPRILHGAELEIAAKCYDAIHNADMVAETSDPEREAAFRIADNALAEFDGYARTKEAGHAKRVLSYYLAEVKELPRLDRECTVLRLPMALDPSAKQATLEQTVPFLKCMSARYSVERNIRSCRNESRSYLELGTQPPVDVCVYNHETPVVERR